MGRKAVNKERAHDPDLVNFWADTIFPLLQQRGIKALTMDEIASYLGVSKATIYAYFGSQEEFFDYTIGLFLKKLEAIHEHKDTSAPFEVRYIDLVLETIKMLSQISTLLLQDLERHYPKIWKRIKQTLQIIRGQLLAFLQEGIDQGYIQEINPAIIAIAHQSTLEQIINPDFLISNNLTLEKAIQDYIRMMGLGLIRDKKTRKEFENTIKEQTGNLSLTNINIAR